MSDKTLSNFFEMFRFSAIIAPINSNKHKLANFIGKHSNLKHVISNIIPDNCNTDLLIIYDSNETNFNDLKMNKILSMSHPPKYITIIIGLGVTLEKLEILKRIPSIGLIYAEFAEITVELKIKLLPISNLKSNLILTGHERCIHEICSHIEKSYISTDHYFDKTLSMFHFTSGISEKTIIDIITGGGETKKEIFIYYDFHNHEILLLLEQKIKDDIEFYEKLKSFCNTKIYNDSNILKITN